MSSVPSVAKAVAELASTFSGQLLRSADAGYEEARRVHNDTGFPHRREGYNFIVVGEWMEPRDTDRCIAWARETFAKMQRFAVGRYVNYLTDDKAIDAVATVYGPNYGLIDKRPALIARCRGVADVVDAVNLSHKLGLDVAVRWRVDDRPGADEGHPC